VRIIDDTKISGLLHHYKVNRLTDLNSTGFWHNGKTYRIYEGQHIRDRGSAMALYRVKGVQIYP
jgi:hypothetical protein